MRAVLKNYRQSPRKVRLVADAIKGKSVDVALSELQFLGKRASDAFSKLLHSAISNAEENDKKQKDRLFIKEVRVDEGPTLRRSRPRARGRATPIRKRTSHIELTLEERSEK